jgi:hypothetical protein
MIGESRILIFSYSKELRNVFFFLIFIRPFFSKINHDRVSQKKQSTSKIKTKQNQNQKNKNKQIPADNILLYHLLQKNKIKVVGKRALYLCQLYLRNRKTIFLSFTYAYSGF